MSNEPVRLQPHSLDVEEALLGSLMIDGEMYHEVAPILRPNHFYFERCKHIFEAIQQLTHDKEPVDFLTVQERLKAMGSAVDEPYLIDVLNAVPTSINAVSYAKSIEAYALRRGLIRSAEKIATLAYDLGQEVDHVLTESESAVFDVTHHRNVETAHTMKAIMRGLLARLDSGDSSVTFTSSIDGLNNLVTGYRKGAVYLLAAETGGGKSAFALQEAEHVARAHDASVLYFTIEMSHDEIGERLASGAAGVDSQTIKRQKLSSNQRNSLYSAAGQLGELKITVDDSPVLTLSQLRSKCLRAAARGQADFIVVDHVHIMSHDDLSVAGGSTAAHKQISRGLKALAKEVNAPLLVLAQMNRNSTYRGKKEPEIADIYGSGSYAQDSDYLWFIHRDTEEADNSAELIVKKARNDKLGRAQMIWKPAITRFVDKFKAKAPKQERVKFGETWKAGL